MRVTRKIKIYGIVQGVGFRPTVARLAEKTGVTGTVCNRGSFVEVNAQGEEPRVADFIRRIGEEPPERAVILKMDVRDFADAPVYEDFSIVESAKTKGEIFVSPDIALCDTCRREMLDPQNRRYLHPFINCTSCGPRLTILESLPYDRERTSMKMFPMCPACHEEYVTPSSRRYDAQPVCCNECGPEVYLIGRQERGRDAILAVRRVLQDGGIAAVKGIGGFHLCCNAEDTDAVERLRRLKNRPAKPFAVMFRDEAAVRAECLLTPAQARILTGHQKPILLLTKKAGEEAGRLSPAVAPDNPKVGVMLPYAPVQVLLFQYDDGLTMPPALVMTSGNVSGAPICRSDEEAVQELSAFVDVFLSHNRRILIRCDDSVMDFRGGEPYMIRRSRGYAPLPYLMSDPHSVIGESSTVLAIGGELKNTFCIGKGKLFYPSSYIGDLADVRSGEALRETVRRFETLLEAEPDRIVCDLHPGYRSTEIAQEMAAESGVPFLKVQHHYAHILSCMAENDCMDPVIGFSYDGTGYGTDGTIWGGEILLADVHGFRRLGSVVPFLHIGGDTASREGWRIAASLLCDLYGRTDECERVMISLGLCSEQEARVLHRMHDTRLNAVESTSLGRIFDAVSAILGIRRASTFEGEASTTLMFRAMEYQAKYGTSGIRFSVTDGNTNSDPEEMKDEKTGQISGKNAAQFTGSGCGNSVDDSALLHTASDLSERRFLLRTDTLVRKITELRLAGEDPGKLALYFHEALAEMSAEAAIRMVREDSSLPHTAALSGGCFQNTLLTDLLDEKLQKAGFRVLTHHLVPPNDGGIALGQALYGSVHGTV